jgi:hypothetical protein
MTTLFPPQVIFICLAGILGCALLLMALCFGHGANPKAQSVLNTIFTALLLECVIGIEFGNLFYQAITHR